MQHLRYGAPSRLELIALIENPPVIFRKRPPIVPFSDEFGGRACNAALSVDSSPGVPLQANWSIPNATVRQWLGRDLAGSAPNITVNLLAPGEMRSDRVNILDFRVGKVVSRSRHRALVALDLYNVLNLDTVLGYNQTYVPNGSWLIPQSVLTARTAKLTVQYDF